MLDSEVSLVDVHEGTVIPPDPIGETEALIEATSGNVGLIDADVHCVRPPSFGFS
jgi:hypothetical protein